MTRPLLIVFACALIVCIACFAVASGIGPLPHRWFRDHIDMDVHDGDFGLHPREGRGGGPTVTRTLTWGGGDVFEINVPARIVYTQGATTSLEVSGPQRSVEALALDGDTLRFSRRMRDIGRITVTMTAPNVSRFELNGAQELTITGYDQDRLKVSLRGAGEVVGHGRAREVEVEIMGAGDVDLGDVAATSAEVSIAGAGDAVVSPTESVEVNIAGAGDVTLTTRPPKVRQHVAGAGNIKYIDPLPPAAPASPAAPPAPEAAARGA